MLEDYPGNSFSCELSQFNYEMFKQFCEYLSMNIIKLRFIDRILNMEDFQAEEEFNTICERLPRPAYEDSLLAKFRRQRIYGITTKNHPLKPEYFSFGSNRRFYFKCSQGHSFKRKIQSMFRVERKGKESRGIGNCPICPKPKVVKHGVHIEINGVRYTSLTDACRRNKISRIACYHYGKYHGIPLVDVITKAYNGQKLV